MENTPARFKKILKAIWLIGKIGTLIGVPIFLLLAPMDFFDKGTSISLFERIGVEGYYSKGLTRGVMHLIHLDFKGAAEYNKISFIVLPLIIVIWAGMLFKESKAFHAYFFSKPSISDSKPNDDENQEKDI